MASPMLSKIADIIGPGGLAMAISRHEVKLVLLGAAGVVALLLVISPAFWKAFWAPSKPGNGKASISPRRMLVAYGLLALILGGTLVDEVLDSEHWPWSVYPMYSYMWVGKHYDDYRLYGVPKDNPNTEISLWTDERYLQPFDQSRLGAMLTQLVGQPELHEGLVDCLMRYEALRRGGRHPGPELVALRMYHVYWTLDPWGATIEKPDRKVEIEEVTLPTGEKS